MTMQSIWTKGLLTLLSKGNIARPARDDYSHQSVITKDDVTLL